VSKKKTALIIVAHPDDEVIGVGGTILKLQKDLGYDVHVAFMTTTKQNARWDQAYTVSQILGTTISRPHFASAGESFAPLFLDTTPKARMVSYIEELINEHEPQIVFTHHAGDNHQDHRAIAEAVMIATRPYPKQIVKRVYAFDTTSSTEWSFGEFKSFEPNVFIDITPYFNIKKEALNIYKEEILDLPRHHARSMESLEMSSSVKGSIVGFNKAETFRLIRSINIL